MRRDRTNAIFGNVFSNYPAFTLHEIATICYAQFGRRPSPHTIQLILVTGLKPSRTTRRYPLYAAFDDPAQGRLAIIRLHFEGWSVKSIAGYLGEYRVSAALEQMGIKLSPRTCGRILASNRDLYHFQVPRSGGRPKKELPYQSERRHQHWFVDVRYLEMHTLGGGMIYCVNILEGYSRAILASAVSRRQGFEEHIAVLYVRYNQGIRHRILTVDERVQ